MRLFVYIINISILFVLNSTSYAIDKTNPSYPDVKIIKSHPQGITLEWTPLNFKIKDRQIENKLLKIPSFDFSISLSQSGQLDLPSRILTIGVPKGANETVEKSYFIHSSRNLGTLSSIFTTAIFHDFCRFGLFRQPNGAADDRKDSV